MDWILNNLQILFLVAIAVATVVQRLKKAEKAGETPRPAAATPEEEERTRRVQEDIRRRIMERRGLAPADSDEEEPRAILAAPPMIEEVRPLRVETPSGVAAAAAAAEARIAAELKRQQEMVERVRALEEARRSKAVLTPPVPAGAAAGDSGEQLLPDLRSGSGLRRAIMLREILGPPVALR
jgi:hypothetical protein